MVEELSDMERKAYELILQRGKKGIFQNELWKILGINSREASRIVNKLMKKGLIVRQPAVNRGRKTYLLLPISEARQVIKLAPEKLEARIDITRFLDIPCVKCPHIDRCYIGGFYDPIKCTKLDEWIKKNIEREGISF